MSKEGVPTVERRGSPYFFFLFLRKNVLRAASIRLLVFGFLPVNIGFFAPRIQKYKICAFLFIYTYIISYLYYVF